MILLWLACAPDDAFVPRPPAPPLPEPPGAPPPPTPTLSMRPPGSAFVGERTVTLTLEPDLPRARLRYTLDGSVPGEDALAYEGPITISDSTLVRAVALLDEGVLGSVAGAFVALEPGSDGFSSDLPVLVLSSPLNGPEIRSESDTPFALTVFEPAEDGRVRWPSDASASVRAGLRIRGSTSADLPKHPYRIETWGPLSDEDRDIALLGLPPDADWVLTAPLSWDRALMRDALAYALSNDIGRYAPRTAFAEVFLADEGEPVGRDDYLGVYVVTERIERGSDRVDIARLDPEDVALPELGGGYLFKEDRLGEDESGFEAGTAGGAFVFEHPFVYVEPSEARIAPEQADYLAALLDELAGALASGGGADPETGRRYDEIIDVDAWIDHHVLNVFFKNPDAFRLSAYYHKDRDGRLVAGPIWDFDRSMGCAADARSQDPTWWDATHRSDDTSRVFRHGLWRGLFDDPAFQERYFARMGELLAGELSVERVHARIEEMADALDEAAERNFEAWPDYPPRRDGFLGEVELLEEWFARRHAWIVACLGASQPRLCKGDPDDGLQRGASSRFDARR